MHEFQRLRASMKIWTKAIDHNKEGAENNKKAYQITNHEKIFNNFSVLKTSHFCCCTARQTENVKCTMEWKSLGGPWANFII